MERLDIGKQVLAARKQKGWDQTKLAERAKVERCQISRIENGGDCRMSTLVKIVRALDVMLIL